FLADADETASHASSVNCPVRLNCHQIAEDRWHTNAGRDSRAWDGELKIKVMRSTEHSSGARWLACIAVLALTIVGAGAQTSNEAAADPATADQATADQADVPADQPAQAPADEAAAIPFDQLDFSVLSAPMLEIPLRAWPATRGDAAAPAIGSR